MAYRLESSETIAEGMCRLLLELVEQIIADLLRPEISRDEGVHDARKNCKRVRAAYRLIRDEIGEPLYHQENIRFRDTARSLAMARDSWVMVLTLDKLILDYPGHVSDQTYLLVREKLIEQYQVLLKEEAKDQTKIPAIVESLHQACVQIELLPVRHEGFSAFRGGVRRVYFRGRKAFETAYVRPSPEIFHEWRKRAKYLWHHLEILELIWPEVLANLADDLHALSDYLGADHDLAVLKGRILDELSGFKHDPSLMLLIEQERQNLEALARPLGGQIYHDPPETFVQRLEAHWDAR